MNLRNAPSAPTPQILKLIIDGDLYTYSNDFELAAGASADFLISVGSHDVILTLVDADVLGAETLFVGYCDATVSNNGAPLTARNHNRQKPDASKTKLYSAPTITELGTEVARFVAYAANQPGKVQIASAETLSNYILKRNSQNIFRITNRDNTNATKVSMRINFLEVDL